MSRDQPPSRAGRQVGSVPAALPAGTAARLRAASLTYDPAALAAGRLPPGYRRLRCSGPAGAGPGAFARAASDLLGWRVHQRAGLAVAASPATAEPGAVVLLTLRAGPLRVTAPCRVVRVVSEPDRAGFSYGTLTGHPEQGEESFLVERHADDRVTFTVTACSRPASLLARAAGPAGRLVQHRITARYLQALASCPGRR
jgi:uncharacterized protein (UPF0548 family)